MMRATACLGLVFGLAVAGTAVAATPNPNGHWARADGAVRINIAPCGDKLCATNIWVKDPAGDEKLGDTLIMTLKPASETTLKGQAYDQRRKMTYSMEIDVQASQLQTHGCVLIGILCKTAAWSRIQ